ncbi:MAG TPA: fused MFS/spermidine synthase [Gammaproteobacteria bacterium]
MSKPTTRLAYYAFAVFVSSAILLVLEIVAGRLIAPYVGASLYTWTSIIGVILAGLSLGNWLGGVLADRGAGPATAGWALALSGLAALAILGLLTLVAPLLQESRLGLLSSSFLYVATLFFVPALGLGVITPLLTTLALGLDRRTGHVVGRMHALAALGSIVGTFATGYWLVQYLGTRAIVIGSGVVLLLLALPLFEGRRWSRGAAVVAAGVLLLAAAAWRDGLASPCDRESQYFCIRVFDEPEIAPWGTARSLVLDHLAHGINHREDPRLLVSHYVHLIDELLEARFAGRPQRAYFFAGGGAYTLPRALRAADPQARMLVAELDPAVTATVQRELFVDTAAFEVRHDDARVVLGHEPAGSFDAVVSDVFHDLSVPYHMLTREYFALARSRLKPGGMLLLNVIDRWPEGRLIATVLRTLEQDFAHREVWLEAPLEGGMRHTFVIAASDAPLPQGSIQARSGLPRRWRPVSVLLHERYAQADAAVRLSDDWVPVERLLAPVLVGEMGR